MADTSFTIEGNLTRDPELRYTPSGRAVVRCGVAVNVRSRDAGGNQTERTDFFDVEAWNKLAENISDSLKKGDRILATGTIKQDTWENEAGEKQSRVKFTANAAGPCLRWATTESSKNDRSETRTPAMAGAPAAEGTADEGFDEEPF